MKHFTLFFLASSLLLIAACTGSKKSTKKDDNKIDITFLQLNDVYEIAPLDNGKVAGMARVATVSSQLKQENPNTYTVLSGDFLSPSAIGTLKYEGKTIKGKQMVETMNAVGVDFVTFGNHEFDIKETELQDCLDLSNFKWVSANIKHKTAAGYEPFAKTKNGTKEIVTPTYIINAKDADGTTVRVGVIGTTLNFTMPDYARYYNADSAAIAAYNFIKNQTDFVVLLTHQSIDQDKQLAAKLPQVQLIMGGHEHDNMLEKVGAVTIAKADANVKTVYIHRLQFDKKTKKLSFKSELKAINDKISQEPQTFAVVEKWNKIAEDNCIAIGMNPKNVVMNVPTDRPLEGRETFVRSQRTNLTLLIANAIRSTNPKADAVIYNSGSIRVDDQLSGNITEYDILRTLPFGGKILTVDMKGKLLSQILEQGAKNIGSGGFLQYDEWISQNKDNQKTEFWLGKQPIEPNKLYKVLITDFLLTGKEKGLPYLTRDNPDIQNVAEPDSKNKADLQNDLRLAIIDYLKKGGK